MSDSTQNPPPQDEPPSYPPPPTGGGYQPTPPPPMEPMQSGIGQPADLMPRFLARLIDYVLLTIVNVIIVTTIIVGTVMGSSADAFSLEGGQSFAVAAVSSILSVAITLGYFALMESQTGRTIGKMALKLETRGAAGGKPTLEEALKRNAFTAIGLIGIIPFLGWVSSLGSLVAVIMIAVTINNSPIREGWHDKFAGGTKVIKAG